MNADALQHELIELSHQLGLESRQLAILGEGNSSVDCNDGTFWVKASGTSLSTLQTSEVSRVRFDKVLAMLGQNILNEQEVEDGLLDALTNTNHKKPSVETFLHALCLTEGEAKWVGHTHPVSANQILCSKLGAAPFERHIFPDAIVVCGTAPAIVPYTDPGFALAKAVKAELKRYKSEHGKAPKLLLMENHGLVALGQSSKEVLNISLMVDKWAKILWGSYALGMPQFLPDDDVNHIDARLDEIVRRRELLEG